MIKKTIKLAIIITLLISCTKTNNTELFIATESTIKDNAKIAHIISKKIDITNPIFKTFINNTHKQGKLPLIKLILPTNTHKESIIEEILDGIWDNDLNYIATEIKQTQSPVCIQLNNQQLSPENYLKLYEYIQILFKESQTYNVFWTAIISETNDKNKTTLNTKLISENLKINIIVYQLNQSNITLDTLIQHTQLIATTYNKGLLIENISPNTIKTYADLEKLIHNNHKLLGFALTEPLQKFPVLNDLKKKPILNHSNKSLQTKIVTN